MSESLGESAQAKPDLWEVLWGSGPSEAQRGTAGSLPAALQRPPSRFKAHSSPAGLLVTGSGPTMGFDPGD